jgi:hypothetical protein
MKKPIGKGNFSGELGLKNGLTLSVNIPMIVFEEDELSILYCPALDLNGYGKTEDEALEAFKITLQEYFRYTINKGTLREDLKKHGWTIPRSKSKPMLPPNLSELLRDNLELEEIFNDKSYRKFDMPVEIPAFA